MTGANGIGNGPGYRISATQANVVNRGDWIPTTVFIGRSVSTHRYLDLVAAATPTDITDVAYDVGNNCCI